MTDFSSPPLLYTLPSNTTGITTAPQPLPSDDGLSTSAPVPTNLNTHQCMAGDKTHMLLLGNGHSITFTAQNVPPPPTTTFTDNISTACGMMPACTGTRTLFLGSKATRLLLSIGLLSTCDGELGTGTHSKHNSDTGRSVTPTHLLILGSYSYTPGSC